MTAHWKIAGVQMDIVIGDIAANLARIAEHAAVAAREGAKLVIFPECAVTGYCFESLEEGLSYSEPVPGPTTGKLADLCRQLDCHLITGMLERDGERLFNVAVLVGPEGMVGVYRKAHLPYLGVDRFTTPGDRPFEVWPVGPVRVGMHICYDGAFPEAARVMALAGADLIALPTNWPPGAENTAAYVTNTRALENHVYFAAINRVGKERGFRFIGSSRICDPTGKTLDEAGPQNEQILYARVDWEFARNKRLVRVPSKHIIHRFDDRRPELYTALTTPRPGSPTPGNRRRAGE